jgi:site-specific recombinase XerD
MVIRDEPAMRMGHPVLDRYLEFVEVRARPNTVRATASDLRAFFKVVGKEPAEVTTEDVMAFIASQRQGDPPGNLVSLTGGGSGLSPRTIKRRLSLVSGLFAWMVLVGERSANPVPKGLATRRGGRARGQRVPLIRTPTTLPKVLAPAEVDALLQALRRHRDRSMVEAMVFGALRRSEVLGLRLSDLHPAEARVFVADGKGGHQRMVPISPRFFRSLSCYFEAERPPGCTTDAVFVVLKGPRRGQPLTDDGLEGLIGDARARAGIPHLTCHQLRHTCLTRLREAGMSLEALQALAGHRSIESTRIYLHLANEWLAAEYVAAASIIDSVYAEALAQ